MKKLTYFITLSILPFLTQAQDNNYDALAQLFSQTGPQGSARMQAIGGTHTAIGADITSLGGNPAGLGFYTRSEFSVSPLFSQIKNGSQYISTNQQNSSTNQFTLGNIGIILAGHKNNPVTNGGWTHAFGGNYSRQSILKNSIRFGGRNTYSSMADSFAETANNEATDYGTTVNDFKTDLINNGAVFNYPTSMYYYGLLIDPTSSNGYPYVGTEPGKVTNQLFNFTSTGSISQWNVAWGANYMNKLYLGIGIGFTRMNYTTTKSMVESFEDPTIISGFTNTNGLTTDGRGTNFSLGMIYRPNKLIRFGFSVTSPTWYTITETTTQTLQTELVAGRRFEVSAETNPEYDASLPNSLRSAGYSVETENGVNYITSVPTLSVLPFNSTYELRTPLKLSGGLGLFFGKNAFISADAELVNYTGMKLSSNDTYADAGLGDGTYTTLVKQTYRNVVNLKLGGEYRIQNISLRAGVSYYEDPFKRTSQFNNLDRSRFIISGGVGYRTHSFYVDMAALHSQQTMAYSPYILANTADYASAKIKNQTITGVLTFGVFF
ncbi:MAG: hypothetical protein QM669_12650 [Siphonobacter sp.]